MLQQPTFDDLPGDVGGLLFRMNQELTCPICLCLLDQCTSTPCGHTYCRQCIIHSLKTLSRCPICKEAISKRGLLTSDSMESIVREFLILRQHFEKDSGIILSQMPNKAHQNDRSPQHYAPKLAGITTIEKTMAPTTTEDVPRIMRQLSSPESSTTGHVQQSRTMGGQAAATTTASDHSETLESLASSHKKQTMEVGQSSKRAITSGSTQEGTVGQQNEPSTLSLLLWPPPSPKLSPPSQEYELEENTHSAQAPTTSSSGVISTSSTHVLIYVANQLDPYTISYLGKLHKDGKLDIAKGTHVSAKVTHFVFSTAGGRGIQNVTGSYLQALVLRKWIVNEQWIHQCYESNSVVDPSPYATAYYSDDQEDIRNGPKRARNSAQNKEPLLFHGKVVCFDGSLDVKLKKQFTNLMIAGGGQVIQDPRDMTPDTVMVCQSLSKKKDDHLVATLQCLYGKRPISIAWMTQSILRYELLNEEEFAIGTEKIAMLQEEPPVDQKPRIVWSQTKDVLSIHIMTSSAISCLFYPRHLVLSPIDSPETKCTLRFYQGIDHQPLKLSTKHDHWQIIFLSKEQKNHQWPRLFENDDEHRVEVMYRQLDLEANKELIDFDKVLSSHGNKTGLEM